MLIRHLLLVVSTFLVFNLLPAQAQNPSPQSQPAPELKQPGWLGVWVRPLPAELKAQFALLTPSGEGLMVERVEANSPAAEAGINQFDVLLSLGGQKLYSAEQLSKLVKHSNANSQIEIEIIQQGQVKTLNPTLTGGHKRTLARTQRQLPYYQAWPRYQAPIPKIQPAPEPSTAWDKFETVEVKTLPDGRYRAKVSYKNKSNEIKSFTFEGKKQEIIQQITQLKELPQDKKVALLKALNLNPGKLFAKHQFDFRDDFFNTPSFRQNPFNQPFFNGPYSWDPFNNNQRNGAGPLPPWQFHFYPDTPYWNNGN